MKMQYRDFHFREIPVHEMTRRIIGMDPQMGIGYDDIALKLLKLAPEKLPVQLTALSKKKERFFALESIYL